jgi:sensor c-di-GMP phosphodiesterase-like protein
VNQLLWIINDVRDADCIKRTGVASFGSAVARFFGSTAAATTEQAQHRRRSNSSKQQQHRNDQLPLTTQSIQLLECGTVRRTSSGTSSETSSSHSSSSRISDYLDRSDDDFILQDDLFIARVDKSLVLARTAALTVAAVCSRVVQAVTAVVHSVFSVLNRNTVLRSSSSSGSSSGAQASEMRLV